MTGSGCEATRGMISTAASAETYAHLKMLADSVLNGGFPVIIDAAFLKHIQRKPFQQLARDKQIPFFILEFTASADILRQRIRTREQGISDADISVLEHQLITSDSLHDDELPFQININTETTINLEKLMSEFTRNYIRHIPS